MSIREVKLKYTYYKFFIEFLIENYGMKRLQAYLKKYIKAPEDYKKLFVEVYSHDLDEMLNNFRSSLNKKR